MQDLTPKFFYVSCFLLVPCFLLRRGGAGGGGGGLMIAPEIHAVPPNSACNLSSKNLIASGIAAFFSLMISAR